MRKYNDGDIIKENEYLLKIRPGYSGKTVNAGFMTKFNKNGSMPVAFTNWNTWDGKLEIFIYEENFKSGWKIDSWRIGMSQSWATLIHPEGFTLEIYLQDFLKIVKTSNIIKGELIGSYRWHDHKLIAL